MSGTFTTKQVKGLKIGQKIEIMATKWRNSRYAVGDIVTVTGTDSYGDWIEARTASGDKCTLYSYEAGPITIPFQEGDRVVVGAEPEWGSEGDIGTVTTVAADNTSHIPVYVKFDYGVSYWMRVQDLTLVKAEPLADWERELLEGTPRQIAFEDILVGDKISRSFEVGDTTLTRTGVVGIKDSYGVYTDNGHTIGKPSPDTNVITLLERPVPDNPFVAAKVGTIANNKGSVWIKTKADEWQMIYTRGSGIGSISSPCGISNKYAIREKWEIIHTP